VSDGESKGVDITYENIRRMLLSRKFRQATSNKHLDQIGCTLTLANAGQPPALSLSGHCGEATPWVSNMCALSAHGPWPRLKRQRHSDVLRNTLKIMIATWNPDMGIIWDTMISKHFPDGPAGVPDVGWVTYLAPEYGDPSPLPPPSRIERLPNGGHLFYATPDWTNVESPDDVAALTRVRDVVHGMALRMKT
jgi:hypothetical protein